MGAQQLQPSQKDQIDFSFILIQKSFPKDFFFFFTIESLIVSSFFLRERERDGGGPPGEKCDVLRLLFRIQPKPKKKNRGCPCRWMKSSSICSFFISFFLFSSGLESSTGSKFFSSFTKFFFQLNCGENGGVYKPSGTLTR